jgi:hypothetical protein
MFSKFALAALGAVALLASVPAEAQALRGDAFITAMYRNTLTGKTAEGTPYTLYFLPGGQATIQEGTARPQFGHWSLDRSGDVCLKWSGRAASENGCYRVKMDGRSVTWSNKNGTQKARLLGTVAPLEMRETE